MWKVVFANRRTGGIKSLNIGCRGMVILRRGCFCGFLLVFVG